MGGTAFAPAKNEECSCYEGFLNDNKNFSGLIFSYISIGFDYTLLNSFWNICTVLTVLVNLDMCGKLKFI